MFMKPIRKCSKFDIRTLTRDRLVGNQCVNHKPMTELDWKFCSYLKNLTKFCTVYSGEKEL